MARPRTEPQLPMDPCTDKTTRPSAPTRRWPLLSFRAKIILFFVKPNVPLEKHQTGDQLAARGPDVAPKALNPALRGLRAQYV